MKTRKSEKRLGWFELM